MRCRVRLSLCRNTQSKDICKTCNTIGEYIEYEKNVAKQLETSTKRRRFAVVGKEYLHKKLRERERGWTLNAFR